MLGKTTSSHSWIKYDNNSNILTISYIFLKNWEYTSHKDNNFCDGINNIFSGFLITSKMFLISLCGFFIWGEYTVNLTFFQCSNILWVLSHIAYLLERKREQQADMESSPLVILAKRQHWLGCSWDLSPGSQVGGRSPASGVVTITWTGSWYQEPKPGIELKAFKQGVGVLTTGILLPHISFYVLWSFFFFQSESCLWKILTLFEILVACFLSWEKWHATKEGKQHVRDRRGTGRLSVSLLPFWGVSVWAWLLHSTLYLEVVMF